MKIILIFNFIITFLCRKKKQISNCNILSKDGSKCKQCNIGFKISQNKCIESVPNCIGYEDQFQTSCKICKNGYSIQKLINLNFCYPNFEDNIPDKCKKGYILTAGGYCVFHISNCVQYSQTDFDENKNPLCEECYDSNGINDKNQIYTSDFVLSQNKKVCYAKIYGCLAQQDNICLQSEKDRPIHDSKKFVCVTCSKGQVYQVDACVDFLKPPCKTNNQYDQNYGLVNENNRYCAKIPDSLIPHCIKYDHNKQCVKCKSPLNIDCDKDQFGNYSYDCIRQLQFNPKYILINNYCYKEIMNCLKYTDQGTCEQCYFGYNIQEQNCLKDNNIDMSKYIQKVQFYKIWDGFDVNKKKWNSTQIASTQQIASQYNDAVQAMSKKVIRDFTTQTQEFQSKYHQQICYAHFSQGILQLRNDMINPVSNFQAFETLYVTQIQNQFVPLIKKIKY